jgi:ABC-2 type transport system permease protein
MRMISEEARTGVLEFLLTAPVGDAAVVTGKFLAASAVMALLWSSGLVYAVVLASVGTPPDWGPVLGGFAGAVCVSCLFCSVGLLASASTGTPLLAAFLAFVVDLVWLLLPLARGATRLGWAHALIDRLDLVAHFQRSFLLGVFDSAHAVFYLAWTGFFVFLAVRRLEMRRWG